MQDSLASTTKESYSPTGAQFLRKILLSAVAIAVLVSAGSALSAFQDPLDTPAVSSDLAQKRLLNSVVRAGKRLVAVGQRGHILLSDDDGKQWRQASVPVSSDLLAAQFATPERGWAVGHDGVVLITADAGATWTKQLDGREVGKILVAYYEKHDDGQRLADAQLFAQQGPDKPFLDVWFKNEREGFIIGTFNLILHTTDGGQSWTPWLHRTDNPQNLHLHAIRRVGEDVLIVGEKGLLLKLDHQAERFKALASPYLGSYFGITGRAGLVLIHGLRGNAFSSRDGGVTWKKSETGVSVGLIGSIVLRDGRIMLVDQTGGLLLSADDGQSFKPVHREKTMAASTVVEGEEHLVLVGPHGIQIEPRVK